MEATERTTYGILAQFDSPDKLIEAATKMRDKGFKNWDVHSPYPIHGMDDAMGEERSKLGLMVAAMAILGGLGILYFTWWTSAVDYPFIISGKPYFAYIAYVPIFFAVCVLLSAFTAVFGMLGLVDSKFHHPVFYSDNFAKVTDDGFFVSVLSDDPSFDKVQTRAFLEEIGGKNVEYLEGDD